jgi:hypothetical protein
MRLQPGHDEAHKALSKLGEYFKNIVAKNAAKAKAKL